MSFPVVWDFVMQKSKSKLIQERDVLEKVFEGNIWNLFQYTIVSWIISF
jgi:hypothetical protein